MKYVKLIEYITDKNNEIFDKNEIYKFYFKIYKNTNIRSFENAITYLKSNNIISEIIKNKIIIVLLADLLTL